MSQPYIGEIRMCGFNFAPAGWAFCNGQLLQITEYDTLFNLIGTTYGGDGQTTFALPDLRGRVPLHLGTGRSTYIIGQNGGTETVTLMQQQMPNHTHPLQAQSADGDQANPAGTSWAASSLNQFSDSPPDAPMNPASVGTAGGSQPHDNMLPFLSVNFIISLFGIYPTPN
ncbi:MAG: tail fiber protein [Herpetosiphon sp.]